MTTCTPCALREISAEFIERIDGPIYRLAHLVLSALSAGKHDRSWLSICLCGADLVAGARLELTTFWL
jgi:hypothetical protein